MVINLDTIEYDLKQWGAWERIKDGPNLGYPNMTPYRRQAGASLDWDHDVKDVPIYLHIDDDKALEINKTVAFIGRANEQVKDVIKFRFINQMSLVEIGKMRKSSKHSLNNIGRNKASELLRRGFDLYRMVLVLKHAN